jgi:hypothetical protein
VVADVTWLLHPHNRHCHLRPLHALECWSGVPTDGTLGPRRLSMGPSRPPVHHPRLGALPQLCCTGAWVLVIGSSGGGKGRRRRRQSPPDHGGHRPCTSIVDPPDDENLHRSTGSTPRTARVEDHHATHLADSFPSHATTVDTSIN